MSAWDDRVEAWRRLLVAHAAALGAIEADLEAGDQIPLPWYDVLLELDAAPGRRYRMQELAEHVVLSRSRVSRIVDELQREGLVVREPDPSDGRASLAVLTEHGRAALRRAAPVYLASIERHFTSHLSDRDRRQLVDALGKVIAAHTHPTQRRAPEQARARYTPHEAATD
ncbi:MAG: MarR family winged helix-turn-helix transcriptional regulator [Chloroflexota bacterium]|nr:MarR family winged helix-turn-helix transcriptional regulator [Chloroflexota bacterium]